MTTQICLGVCCPVTTLSVSWNTPTMAMVAMPTPATRAIGCPRQTPKERSFWAAMWKTAHGMAPPLQG